jgi:hypothetical protein
MNALSILEQLCFSTTRIETENAAGGKFTGTGFFFNLQIEDKIVPIVITNKHVIQGMNKGMFKLTKSDTNNNPIHSSHFTVSFNTDFEKMWMLHPEAEVDLCILPFNQLVVAAKQMGHSLFYRAFDNTLIPDKMKMETLDVVEDIMMIGYPNGLWDATNNMPIIRRGITATDPKIDYNGKKEFLIDAACFPGSSGSPIIICNKGGYTDKQGTLNWGASRLFFLGILYAGPQLTVTGDIKIVTIPSLQQKALSVSHIPNNLGYIIKSEKILDFIPVIKQKFTI